MRGDGLNASGWKVERSRKRRITADDIHATTIIRGFLKIMATREREYTQCSIDASDTRSRR
jgi:hypothetical protein